MGSSVQWAVSYTHLDDAMIAEDYIQKCDRVIRRYPNVVACSGTVYTDGKIQTIHRRVIANRTLYLEKNVPLSAYERKCFRYDLATFCGLMVRADILAKIGLPKSEYFIWYDDTEFSMRLRKYGGIVKDVYKRQLIQLHQRKQMMHGYVFRWQLVPKDMQVQIIWKSQKGIVLQSQSMVQR